ncbi:MAG: hypothetical protein AABW73_03245 [Nanoarchaeota archaeon]
MNSTINKVFSGKIDDEAHGDFVKFSKGLFTDKFLVDAKKQKGGIFSFKTSYEFANYLVRTCASEVSDNSPIEVTGVVVSTRNLKSELPFPISSVKQFAGVKQAIIKASIKPSDILAATEKLPKAFFALSFKTSKSQLKIKAKAPKSGKPSTKGDVKAVPDFCSLKTTNHVIVHDLLFDIKDKVFDSASISHNFEIKRINVPKGVTDPVAMREKATREGTIKRRIILGEEVFEESKEFNI